MCTWNYGCIYYTNDEMKRAGAKGGAADGVWIGVIHAPIYMPYVYVHL